MGQAIKRVAPIFLAICLFALPAPAQGQFNCTRNGPNSQCTASDGTDINCFSYGNNTDCNVTHPDGFVSSGPGPVAGLIGALIAMHRRHVTEKAAHEEALDATISIEYVMLLADSKTLVEHLVPLVPAKQRDAYREVEAYLARQASQFSFAVSRFVENYKNASGEQFRANAKAFRKLHDEGVVVACGTRQSDLLLTGKLDTVRAHVPLDFLKALDAVESDEGLLASTCSSKRAVELLKRQGFEAKAQTPGAPPKR